MPTANMYLWTDWQRHILSQPLPPGVFISNRKDDLPDRGRIMSKFQIFYICIYTITNKYQFSTKRSSSSLGKVNMWRDLRPHTDVAEESSGMLHHVEWQTVTILFFDCSTLKIKAPCSLQKSLFTNRHGATTDNTNFQAQMSSFPGTLF